MLFKPAYDLKITKIWAGPTCLPGVYLSHTGSEKQKVYCEAEMSPCSVTLHDSPLFSQLNS